MNNDLTDTQLMQATAANDIESFQELMGRYSERTIGFLCRFLNDRDRALDLAQETFIRLFQRLRGRGREEAGMGNCRSLIFTIAANLGRDELRRRAVRKEVNFDAILEDRAGKTLTPDVIVEKKEAHSLAQEALGMLPAQMRELLVWREIQGLSYDEISGILGIRLGTVKSRINRARIAFKNAYFRLEGGGRRSGKGGE